MSRIASYLLVAAFFVQESLVRQGEAAKSFQRQASDRGTTVLLGSTYGVVLTATPILNRFARSPLPKPIAYAGLGLMAGGLALRYWAVRTLGEFYSRTLRTERQHRLVESGPYAKVRHPGYAATLLVWTGFGLAQGNLVSGVAVMATMGAAYAYRIRTEEAMLTDALGDEYRAYCERTTRLIPGVF
jgi:protein-S-isoprenylcysteine O-methyltransferase Ste14